MSEKLTNKHIKRADELKEEIKALCDKYDEFAIMVVFEEGEKREFIEIAGNLCPLCAEENLLSIIINKNLKHTRITEPTIPESETKH